MLDFVPNHTGRDHPWVESHPEYYILGTEEDLVRTPQNYVWARSKQRDLTLAYGRDPYFAGWPDTLQLNYGNPALQEAMTGELLRIARQCDGVRCDMAMLVLPDVFSRTWGMPCPRFWPQATERVREQTPGFVFMAEVYWDLEWVLQQEGFDYTYDKRLYDRLREGHARPVREHLLAGLDYQEKMARFLENHDEPRAAVAFAPGGSPSGGGYHVLLAGTTVLPSGPVSGLQDTGLTPPRSRSERTRRRGVASVLRPAARRAPPAGRARWPVAVARLRDRMGRQLDLRLLRGLRLAGPG